MNDSLIIVGSSSAARWSTNMAAAMHAQHAVTVLVGIDTDVSVTFDDDRVLRSRVVVVAPDVRHAAVTQGRALSFLFDPERTSAGALIDRRGRIVNGRFGAAVAYGSSQAKHGEPAQLRAALDELSALVAPPRRLERRIGQAVALWSDAQRVRSVAEIAGHVGISAAQFRALFKADVGISPRRYRLWTLLLRGVAGSAETDITTLAHEAGFADLAHFSRTCRDFFGYAPSRLLDRRVMLAQASSATRSLGASMSART
ncbi:MAG: helix-turn-helix domain-containing protein [Myxococcales bacterium]|nr:helix-turn-helix domain-containing protein [Myxococcales bacterium]